MFGLEDVEGARNRIAEATRRTPMWTATAIGPSSLPEMAALHLKLELHQVSGSFKARGAFSKLLSLQPEELARGVVTASGGNHGLAVAYASRQLGAQATICLPGTVDPEKVSKLKEMGAKVEIVGDRWDQANQQALALARSEKLAYVHAFADPLVAAGQGTIALEILEERPDVDTIVVAIGGGGLITGIAAAAKALKPSVRIVGVEPVGAPTLKACLDAGKLSPLSSISTAAVTLAAGYTEAFNFDVIRRCVDEVVLVTDDDMRQSARWLWKEFAIATELSGAAGASALLTGAVKIAPEENVCVLVCGAGRDGLA